VRLVIALALALTAAAAGAQPAAPLAAGEVLLEVNATGTATSRADLATFTLMIEAQAPSEAEARGRAEAEAARLVAAARAEGVPAGDITRQAIRVISVTTTPEVEAAMRDLEAAANEVAEPGSPPIAHAPPQPVATGRVEVRVRDVARVAAVREVLERNGAANGAEPVYTLTDPRPARDQARRRAIAAARAEADAYAAALGLRVVRIVRVTERVGADLLALMTGGADEMRRLMGGGDGRTGEVTTALALGIDFVLAP